MAKNQIVFIHGLWMHATTWEPWMEFLTKKGYQCFNPGWPGSGATVTDSRSNPKAIANRGVTEVADHYAKEIAKLDGKPILIGHSFGGLLVQILLGRGLAAAAVAIDPAPMKGVWQLPLSALRASFPVLGNPFNLTKSVSLTYPQFRFAFANAVSEDEAKQLYDRWTVPSPGRPLFQVATATLNPSAQTKVNTMNSSRGPLLITSGDKDHIVPPALCHAAFAKYSRSHAITELKTFAGRGHALVVDHGWKEVASYTAEWLNGKGL